MANRNKHRPNAVGWCFFLRVGCARPLGPWGPILFVRRQKECKKRLSGGAKPLCPGQPHGWNDLPENAAKLARAQTVAAFSPLRGPVGLRRTCRPCKPAATPAHASRSLREVGKMGERPEVSPVIPQSCLKDKIWQTFSAKLQYTARPLRAIMRQSKEKPSVRTSMRAMCARFSGSLVVFCKGSLEPKRGLCLFQAVRLPSLKLL